MKQHIQRSTKQSQKKKPERNPYLQVLSDEQLDVLELLAKKAAKEATDVHKS